MPLHQRAKDNLLARKGEGTPNPQNLSNDALDKICTEHQLLQIELKLVYEELRRVQLERDEMRSGQWNTRVSCVSLHEKLLFMIANAASLTDTLDALSLAIEDHFGDLLCSVLLAEQDRQILKDGAGPSLPAAYREGTKIIPIRESSGSCGTAAFRRELVVVEDIRVDPLWSEFRDLAISNGLLACWSTPIVDANGRLMGTFAIYKREPARPSPEHLNYFELATQIAIVAINKERQDVALRDRKRELRMIAQAEREEAFTRLEKIAKEVPGVVFQFRLRPDGTSCLPYASDGIRCLYSIAPEALQEDAAQLFAMHHPEDQAKMDASIQKSASEMSPWKQEFRLLTKDGRTRWISGNSIPEREPDGSTLWHGFLADVTDRKEAEAAHEALQSQLRESQKLEAVGTLAGGIAHDFNNILAIILSNTELARLNMVNSTSQSVDDNLKEIEKAGLRAKALVSQIISFSRRQQSDLKPIQLAFVVEESVRLLRAVFPARIALHLHIAVNVPLVLADATLIEQVIINLATNSMQAMRGREGRVDITLDCVSSIHGLVDNIELQKPNHLNQMVRIIVADNGCGMDAEVQARIFEPFFTTKKVGEGTGLGLSVVHGIVTSHGGTISVTSRPGHGTAFTICLPISSTIVLTESDASEILAKIVQQIAEPSKTNRPHILIVDDDEPVLTSFKFLLEHFGYLVSDYANSREAFEAFCVDPSEFGLVLIDYNMPVMSGIEMAREIRSIRKGIPIAITSGYIDSELSSQAEAVGIHDIIPKPCEISDLKSIVSRLIAQ